jgi:hypothetical protein
MPRNSPGADIGARLEAMEARLAELEEGGDGRFAARAEYAVERLMGSMLPPEARGHMRAARKEQLLAVRSFIDHWIERLDRPPEPRKRRSRRSSAPPRRRESIPLE